MNKLLAWILKPALDRIETLENWIIALEDRLDWLKDSIALKPIQDPEPRFYAGDEDISELGNIWIALVGQSISFGLDYRTDILSEGHSGIFYVIPGDEIQKHIIKTGYDLYIPGIVEFHSGNKSPEKRNVIGVARWVNLPEEHPRAGARAIIFKTPDFEKVAAGQLSSLSYLQLAQLAGNSRMDIPWHAHYGYIASGSVGFGWKS